MFALSKRQFQSMIAVVKAMPRLMTLFWGVYRLVIFATFGWGFVGVLTKLSTYGKNPLPVLGKNLHVDPFALSAARSLPYLLLTVCYVSWQIRKKAPAEEKSTWLWSTGQACGHIFLSRDPVHWTCAISAATSTALYAFAMLNSTGGFVSYIASAYLVPVGLFSGTLLGHKLTKEDKEVLYIWAAAICIMVFDGIWRGETIGVLLGCLCMSTTAVNQISVKRRSTEEEVDNEDEEDNDEEQPDNGENAPVLSAKEKRGTEGLESWALSAAIVSVVFSRNIWLAGLPSWRDFVFILAFGTLATWLPDLCYVKALKRMELLHAVVVSRIGNVLTPILIWLILGEQMPIFSVIPAVMVVAVVIRFWIQQEERKRRERIKKMQRIWSAVAENKLTSQEALERALLLSSGSIGVRSALRLITESSGNQDEVRTLDEGILMKDIDHLIERHRQNRSLAKKP